MATPVNNGNEPQLNGPQHEAARQIPDHNQDVPQAEPPPEQPPTTLGADEPSQPHTIKLKRPPPKEPPERSTARSLRIHIGGFKYSRSTVEGLAFCARKPITKTTRIGVTLESPGAVFTKGVEQSHYLEAGHSHIGINELNEDVYRRYIVVGVIGNERSIPHEILLPILTPEDLFKQIRKAERELRSPFRRLLSLKRIGGFGLYRCHPNQDYHSNPDISHETTQCLVELYRNYRTEKSDYQDRWMDWIHENFNNNSPDPKDGNYTLQLLLQWSPLKLIIWSSIPIIFSLVIGLWYMINPNPGEDYVAIVQTAWTIASYIVTTTALVLAVIASITQFGDI